MRGFRRLGVALALPCFIAATGFLCFGLYSEYQWREFPAAANQTTLLADMAKLAGVIGAIGALAFVAMWTLGWVIAGFSRD